MHLSTRTLSGLALAAVATVLSACADTPSGPSSDAAVGSQPQTPTAASPAIASAISAIRLTCERRSNRSRISVDASGLSPATGRYRARVTAAGGTVTSPLQRAVRGQAEFDFDSNPNDVAEGATRIPAMFIRARTGPDVVARVLNAAGVVVATRSGECVIR
jgi:hypothetical protein